MVDVLVVDDDPDLREVVAINLELHGHEVRTVASAEEALLAVAERRPDLLLLDIWLPGVGGDGLIEWLDRGMGRPRCICLLSALPEDQVQAIAEEHDLAWFTKPVDLDALLALVDDLEADLADH